MKTKYVVEFWYNEEPIDLKESSSPLIIPNVGEKIAIMSWENPSNSEGHTWWIVEKIKHAIWKDQTNNVLTQKIMITVKPDD